MVAFLVAVLVTALSGCAPQAPQDRNDNEVLGAESVTEPLKTSNRDQSVSWATPETWEGVTSEVGQVNEKYSWRANLEGKGVEAQLTITQVPVEKRLEDLNSCNWRAQECRVMQINGKTYNEVINRDELENERIIETVWKGKELRIEFSSADEEMIFGEEIEAFLESIEWI